jgi:hypothetical protein
MRKRLGAALAVAAVGVGLSLPAGASAAPITCSGNQTAERDADGWSCVNNGGNDTGSARHQGNGDKVGKEFP